VIKRDIDFSKITAAILAGGLGTRLRTVVADRPKVMAEIHGRPFLRYLLDQLLSAGFRSAMLCTGYLGEQIADVFGNQYKDLQLSYSLESRPLGTAGALRLALPQLVSNPVLVMNGDSYCHANLRAFGRWYLERSDQAAILLTQVADSRRYGSVKLADDGTVIEFGEKLAEQRSSWINAGVYLLNPAIISSIPVDRSVSLEYDVFPGLVGQGLSGYRSEGLFLDIGTPDDFKKAQEFFAPLAL
jgi:D-glycero-alpha-D-manno-heptose 1-phosphate guanylyltransferase